MLQEGGTFGSSAAFTLQRFVQLSKLYVQPTSYFQKALSTDGPGAECYATHEEKNKNERKNPSHGKMSCTLLHNAQPLGILSCGTFSFSRYILSAVCILSGRGGILSVGSEKLS